MGAWILTAVAVVAVVPYLRWAVRGPSVKALAGKTVCSALFVGAGIAAALTAPSSADADRAGAGTVRVLAVLIVAGLVFGLLGDVFLDLAGVRPAIGGPTTLAGFGAFALGHASYITALIVTWRPPWVWLGVAVAAASAAVGAVVANQRRLHLNLGALTVPAGIYGVLLCLTFATALISAAAGTPLAGGGLGQPSVMAVGAALFIISDSVLATQMFGTRAAKPAATVACMLTYYAAQFTIALSLLAV
jgi:uncharacterized membrane protein YhhN